MSSPVKDLPDGTQTVIIGLGDTNGQLRGKRLPASHWPNVRERGVAMSIATFAIDMTCDVWDTPYVNFDNGYPDMHVVPTGEVYPVPWEEGVAFTFATSRGAASMAAIHSRHSSGVRKPSITWKRGTAGSRRSPST